MLELIQQSNYAICADGAVEKLAEKKNARLLVVSDSHGSRDILMSILRKFGKGTDALCFCGDGMPDLLGAIVSICHNPSFAEFLPPVIFFVRGNGDNSTYTVLANSHLAVRVPIEIEFTVAGKKIFMTHGHRYDVYYGTKDLKSVAREKNASIAFYGHTHISNIQYRNKLTVLNPGSCSLPRGGLPHTFALVNIDSDTKSEKPDCDFYELKWDSNGEIAFYPYSPSTDEINLFW